jgi:glycerol-3-phosphate dehydrogenase
MMQRDTMFSRLADAPFDVLIIGGGIVGAGIARDAAMRGLRVALVEQHDFAFGASSRSSRLLHGGLRYLAQGRIGLVREASIEKKIIHQIAPHLARPLPFVFPVYHGNKNWRLWKLKIGVKIYDLLCGGRNFGKSTWLNTDELMCKVPSLAFGSLSGGVRYYDAFTNDARLTLDTLRSAAKAGATLVNYCRFQDSTRSRLWDCAVENVLTRKTLHVQARHIVNATGPWADRVPHSQVKLRVTKGIHIVVERIRVPVPETVVMTEGGRILFAIPWGERTILGTTDTDFHGSANQVTADADDIGYVLQITNQFFPRANLTGADVVSSWAGLRPLLASPGGQPSGISRSHEIKNPEAGWWDVTGGKLTTYRLMAEQTVDRILATLKKPKGQIAPCRTATEPLLTRAETDGISGILPPGFDRSVVEYYCANEWAMHLDDVMVRRTSWQYYFANASERAEQLASWMGELLGWTETLRAEEIARYRAATGCQPAAKKSSLVKIPQPSL